MSAMDIEKAAQEVFNAHHKSVVLLLSRKNGRKLAGKGTGFILGGRGTSCLVLTCSHFIKVKPKYEYFVRLPGEATEYKAEKMYQCSDADIGMLQVRDIARECPPLHFRDSSYSLPCESTLFMLGYVAPRKLYNTKALTLFPAVSPLRVSTPHRQNGPGNIEDVVCTGAAKKGVSGAPVMLGHHVVGLIYTGVFGVQECHVRPVETIKNVLKSWLNLPLDDPITTENLIELFLKKFGM